MSAPPKHSFVPPIIKTTTSKASSDNNNIVELSAALDDILHSHDKQQLSTDDYDSVTEDTSVDYSTELEYSIADDEEDESYVSDDEDSTRRLLKQAHQRLEHQSIYEEVKLLRAQLNERLEVVNKCNQLEHQLSKATHTIEMYKQKEKEHKEEMARSEMEFMNKLNEMCEMMELEVVNRDEKIAELQSKLNERDTMIAQLRRNKSAGRGDAGDVCFSDFI